MQSISQMVHDVGPYLRRLQKCFAVIQSVESKNLLQVADLHLPFRGCHSQVKA